jgi:uncharacterized protein (DUF4415 family)
MNMRDDLEHYKNFDFSQAKLVKPEIIKKLQKRHAEAQAKVLDADVVTWLSTQDLATQQHINEVIRHFMAVKTA